MELETCAACSGAKTDKGYLLCIYMGGRLCLLRVITLEDKASCLYQ